MWHSLVGDQYFSTTFLAKNHNDMQTRCSFRLTTESMMTMAGKLSLQYKHEPLQYKIRKLRMFDDLSPGASESSTDSGPTRELLSTLRSESSGAVLSNRFSAATSDDPG